MAFDLPDWPGFRTYDLTLLKSRESTESPLTLERQYYVRTGSRWLAEMTLPRIFEREAAEAWAAGLIRGIEEPFYLTPPNAEAPMRGEAFGTPLVQGAGQTGRKLNVDGLTPGFALLPGDYWSFSNGFFEELHKAQAGVTASGAGAAQLTSLRAIRRAPADNAPLRLERPRGEFILEEPEFTISVDLLMSYDIAFRAMER